MCFAKARTLLSRDLQFGFLGPLFPGGCGIGGGGGRGLPQISYEMTS